MDNFIVIRLFGIIKIYKMNINSAEKRLEKLKKYVDKKKHFKGALIRLLKKTKFKKFALILGFNLGDVIINSYVNAMINSIICMYINYKQENFNLKELYYQVQITESPLILNFHCIFKVKSVDTIKEVMYEHKKVKKENGEVKTFEKRSDLYGRTSN